MHIQEGTNTILTTCTKMTEEVDRRHGVNGNSSSKSTNEETPVNNSALNATGGRLKFFKDGKFILELVRGSPREGARAGWVSVPRKTFWPPAAPAPAPAASLSASDDTSSLHSSPWQRDHCWKQPAPRRNLSKELALYYCRPSTLRGATIAAAARRKRRRPFDAAPPPANGHADDEDHADDRRSDFDRQKYYHMKLKRPYQYHKLRVYSKTRPGVRRGGLGAVLERLRARVVPRPEHSLASPRPERALASPRPDRALVSPRKRVLRELEEAAAGRRRARPGGPAPSPAPCAAPPGPSHAAPRAAPRHVSAYSIHSLLSMGDEAPAAEVRAGGARWSPAAPYALYPCLPPAALYRPPLWMQYALPPAPPPWPPLLSDHIPRDEPTSDLPLNLSKH